MRDVETIAKELSAARDVYALWSSTNVPRDEIPRAKLDVAYRRADLRVRVLEAELRAAIEAEETPE